MRFIPAKQILSGWANGSWFGGNYNMNIYKGCSHGCIYCDSRSECYRVDNFDEVRAKVNVLGILATELRSKRRKGVVGNGAMSDPYNPQEAVHKLTRGSLELIHKYGFGAGILTKSDLVVRDLDILKKIQEHSPVVVKFTITTFDDELCRKLEPWVAPTSRRLEALRILSEAGIMTGVLIWPLLPFINDTPENVLKIIGAAAERGASFISPAYGVTLRQNQRMYFYEQLDRLFPGLKQRYIQVYGNSYECHSPRAGELKEAVARECTRLGLPIKMREISTLITAQKVSGQLSLFD